MREVKENSKETGDTGSRHYLRTEVEYPKKEDIWKR